MADTEKNDEAPVEAPKKSKLPLIIGAVAVVAAGAVAYIVMRPGAKPAAAKKEVPHSSAPADDAEAGPVVTLSPFVVNLADEDQVSYLKCTVALEVADKEWAAVLEKKSSPLRSSVILYLSSLFLADTRGTKNKEKIIAELGTRISDVVGKGGIRRVYLTEFVIQ